MTTLLGVSSSDGTTPVTLYADPTTHRLLTQDSGGSAPSDATFVTLTTNATLTNERVLTGTANQVTITDNGAGSTVVLSLPQSIATSSTPTFASMTLSGASSLTLGTASTAAGAILLKNATNANTATIVSGVTSSSYSVTWPVAQASGTQVLQNNGAGVLSWATAATGTVTDVSVVTANGVSGSVATSTTTPAITLTLGAITPTTVNGLTITTSTGTLTITNGKTLTASNSITLAGTDGKTLTVSKSLTLDGTDGTTMTFPTTSASVARTDAGQTFTGVQVMTSPSITTSLTTGSSTFDLLPATATTVNFAGASSAVVNLGGGANAAELRFLEPSGSGTNYTALKAQAQGANITYTLPATVASAGQVLTDAAGNGTLSWATAGGGATIIRKTADETVNNSSTMQNDDALVLAVLANEVWSFELLMRFTSSTTADFKWAFTIPAASSLKYPHQYGSSGNVQESDGTTVTNEACATGTDRAFISKFLYIGGANAGNVQLQWAQQVAEASDTKMLANSYIIATKIS